MSIGLNQKFHISKTTQGSWTGSLPDLYEHNHDDLRVFSNAIAKLRQHYSLDDYGVFRVAWEIIQTQGIQYSHTHRTFTQALHHKNWSLASCLLTLVAALRNTGLRTYPLFEGNQVCLLFDVGEEYEMLNSMRMEYTWSGQFAIRAISWNGKDQLGSSRISGTLPSIVFEQERKLRPWRFRRRTIPEITRKKIENRSFELYKQNKAVRFQYFPHVQSYLQFFPSYDFGEQIELAWQEAKLMKFRDDLIRFQRQTDEKTFITTLCRSIQNHTTYKHGPLRSLHDIFSSKNGDCDQLSMLICSLLFECGYTEQDIIGCYWEGRTEIDHIFIGIRPKKANISGSSHFRIPKLGTYYCLDSTYYVRGHKGDLHSSWGNISSEYKGKCKSIPIRIRNRQS